MYGVTCCHNSIFLSVLFSYVIPHRYAPSALCAPARAGILTGRYNHRTGAVDVSSNRGIDRIAPSEKTFWVYFRHAGYTTALIGRWHNGLYNADVLPPRRGFDLFFGFPNGHACCEQKLVDG